MMGKPTSPPGDNAHYRRTRDALDLFRQAILALDDHRVDRTDPGSLARHASEMRSSARFLLDAFLAARGRTPANDQDRAALLEEEPVVDTAIDGVLLEMLGFETPSEWTPEHAEALADVERRYRAALPRSRRALAVSLPGYDGARGMLGRMAGNTAFKWLAAAVLALAVVLAGVYHLSAPAYTLEMNGQVFWIAGPDEPFTEEGSRHFKVRVDGLPHDYSIAFQPPVELARLRIDPVDRVDATEVTILDVSLAGEDGAEEAFNSLAEWTCNNCRWLTRDTGAARLRPLNDDPHLVSPPVDTAKASSFHMTLRASAEKTFWEWVTGLEKPD